MFTESQPWRVLFHLHREHGVWLYSGGHIEVNKDPLTGLCQEVLEETGLDVANLHQSLHISNGAMSLPVPDFIMLEDIPAWQGEGEHQHIDLIYVLQLPEQMIQPYAEESTKVGWFTREEVAELPLLRTLVGCLTVYGTS